NEGGILEALGHLFRDNVKVYIYPYREETQSDELIQLRNIPVSDKAKPLLEYVKATGNVQDIEGFDNRLLHIYSRKVLNMIATGQPGWEKFVPDSIAKLINDKCL